MNKFCCICNEVNINLINLDVGDPNKESQNVCYNCCKEMFYDYRKWRYLDKGEFPKIDGLYEVTTVHEVYKEERRVSKEYYVSGEWVHQSMQRLPWEKIVAWREFPKPALNLKDE